MEWLIAAVVVPVGIFVVGQYLTSRRAERKRDEGERRIRRKRIKMVVDSYVDIADPVKPKNTGPSAFIEAGGGHLDNDGEVREAVRLIRARVPQHDPWGVLDEAIPEGADWKQAVDRVQAGLANGKGLHEIADDLRDLPSGNGSGNAGPRDREGLR